MQHFLKLIIVFVAHIEYSSAQIKHTQNISFIEEGPVQKVLPYKIDYCPLDFGWRSSNYYVLNGLADSSERLIVLHLSSLYEKSELLIIDLESKEIKSIIQIRDLIYFSNSYFYGDSLFLKRPFKSENKYFVYSINTGKRIKKLKDKKCPYGKDYSSGLQEILYKTNKGAYIQELNCKYIIEDDFLTVGKYQIYYDDFEGRLEIITKNE
jgi:hypothetical protein